jgi:hypothetical protein
MMERKKRRKEERTRERRKSLPGAAMKCANVEICFGNSGKRRKRKEASVSLESNNKPIE